MAAELRRKHALPCYACGSTNECCLALPPGDTCCNRCGTACGVTHSREYREGQWVALRETPTRKP